MRISNRILLLWNFLPARVVMAIMVYQLKTELDQYFNMFNPSPQKYQFNQPI